MDVPELRLKSRSPVIHALRTPAPGAYTSTAAPRFEKSLIASGPPHDIVEDADDGPKESPSSHPVLPTVIAATSPAGDVPLASSPEFPAAATTTMPALTNSRTAASITALLGPPTDIETIFRAPGAPGS
mmetsp:Transcript_9937/g.43319  ORF Transcript_9937/g.43319 Transcript_9937/m.43319 type:complete len:129 (-) Transcript_9937:1380-1766(-)